MEARDEFDNLRCHVPGCKTVIRAMTGLQELVKLQAHMKKKHWAGWDMNETLENRHRIEQRGKKVQP